MADYGTVARPYAKAIFDTALEANDLEGWSNALAAAAAVATDRAAREYLSRPELSAEKRSEFVTALAVEVPGAAVLGSNEGRNLIRLLSENDRLDALGEIAAQFDALKAERENKVRVTLVSALPVDADQANQVSNTLSKKLGRTVELALEIDESLIGGAVVRAEDRVIDDSLRARLTRLTNTLID
jgi:F-type H+-transporting ATPase subunit delta